MHASSITELRECLQREALIGPLRYALDYAARDLTVRQLRRPKAYPNSME